MYEIGLELEILNPYCERAGVKADCLIYNNTTTQPHTSTAWGHIKKCDVPTIHECTINQPRRMRTDTYELTNNRWNNIEWNANDGYTNDEHVNIDNELQPYVESSCLFLGMAGTGKSKMLLEAQRILTKSESYILFRTACPAHKACKLVKGETLHRLFYANPIGYSLEYGKALSLRNSGIKYISIDEISMIPEQMWNIIAHIKRLFGFVFCGFGDFKQLKPVNEEHIGFLNPWTVRFIFNNNLCELKDIIDLMKANYYKMLIHVLMVKIQSLTITQEEHDLCLCWTNQAVGTINAKWNQHYATGKQIEAVGYKQSTFILHQ